MIKTSGYAAINFNTPLVPYDFTRREPRPNDILIEIDYCGVCHSDIHQVKNEWGNAVYPMVPGHEIVGHVTKIGSNVSKFKIGDLAGVGCLVDSCRTCANCKEGFQQFCANGSVGTYNSIEKDGVTRTFGGYSKCIVLSEDFALKIPPNLDLKTVAPLLCAGITTYSPLRHWGVGPGQKVGVVGLGGLGHMAVKFAHSFGATVTVFSRSISKKEDAIRLGASEMAITTNPTALLETHAGKFDFIIDTVSAPHDLNLYLQLLKRDGKMVLVGLPEVPPHIEVGNLIFGRKTLAGSLIGGIPETQEMLDYCGSHNIGCDIELIPPSRVNEAFERTLKSDVKYRFVLDMKAM
ncbi:MAG: NAD(P)-dependent alcohol dehydrogenase [Bacteriovorax sp.]|nr:NAD(P)-dependent alcohol dehydrogenase [Bacteriovorax sp.]